MAITNAELENRFNYHAPTEDTKWRFERIRADLLEVAQTIVELTPESREQSLAITHLEDAMYSANAAIARHME